MFLEDWINTYDIEIWRYMAQGIFRVLARLKFLRALSWSQYGVLPKGA